MASESPSTTISVWRIRDVLRAIEDGQFALPQFHRGFVWTSEMRIQLFESLRRGVPIGSILLLRTKRPDVHPSRGSGPFPHVGGDDRRDIRFVLDGFQRLATLYGALWLRADGARDSWSILYDPVMDMFVLSHRHNDSPSSCVELWRLFDSRALFDVQTRLRAEGRETEIGKIEELRETLGDREIPVLEMSTDHLTEALDATLRMNGFGVPWTQIDTLRVSMHSRDRDVVGELEEMREELMPFGWGDVELTLLLDAAKVAAGADFDRTDPWWTAETLAQGLEPVDVLLTAMKRTVRFLFEKCGVAGPRMLPYRWQFVLLVEVARSLGADVSGELAERLRKWFWATTYGAYFSGATVRKLRSAREHVLRVASANLEWMPESLDDRVQPIDRLRGGTVRTTAFLLFLASLRPTSLEGELPVARMLAEGGAHAGSRIFHVRELPEGTDAHAVENRWLAPPDLSAALRAAIARGQGTTAVSIERLLEGHAFSAEAARCLANEDVMGTLVARRAELRRREKTFVESFGLRLVPEGDGT